MPLTKYLCQNYICLNLEYVMSIIMFYINFMLRSSIRHLSILFHYTEMCNTNYGVNSLEFNLPLWHWNIVDWNCNEFQKMPTNILVIYLFTCVFLYLTAFKHFYLDGGIRDAHTNVVVRNVRLDFSHSDQFLN